MSKLSEEATNLHDATFANAKTSTEGVNKSFAQRELMDLSGITEPGELIRIVQELVRHQLFRTLKAERTLYWSPRSREVASQLSSLDNDERLIYEAIENSETTGIWLKRLKQNTGVAPGNVNKIIKKLESSQLIKSIKSVKSPAQRIYMLFHLAPAEDVTGGSFFDSGDLDEGLVEELGNLIVFHVRSQSWVEVKPTRSRHESNGTPIDVDAEDAEKSGSKRKRNSTGGEVAPPAKKRSIQNEPMITQVAFPAGSRGYPTADSIHNFITNSNAIRESKAASITIREVQEILNVLVWDEKLEKVGNGFRTVLGVKFRPPGSFDADGIEDIVGNGLTEAPCGRCPVFDLCAPGGPINAGNCVYFDQWLKA
jgi:DNA-directed RNA polymerase III subunit RPC6